MTKESLIKEKMGLVLELKTEQRKWSGHLLNNHRGVVATTCHFCMNRKVNIGIIEKNINEIEKELGRL